MFRSRLDHVQAEKLIIIVANTILMFAAFSYFNNIGVVGCYGSFFIGGLVLMVLVVASFDVFVYNSGYGF